MPKGQCIHFQFHDIDIRHKNPIIESYFSITYNSKLYFSSVIDDEVTLDISGDIMIPLSDDSDPDSHEYSHQHQQQPPKTISLQRWESHTVVFDFQISLEQLKTKSLTKTKLEIKKDEILTFTVALTEPQDVIFCPTFISKVSQHYLSLENIKIKEERSQYRGENGPSYFEITTQSRKYNIPVINGNCLIYLPGTLKISQFKGGKEYARSKDYTFEEHNECVTVFELYDDSGNQTGMISFTSSWIVNLTDTEPSQTLLLQPVQVTMFDFEIKLENHNDFVGSRLRVSTANKLYEFGEQLGNSKTTKIKKILWIVAKSDDEVIEIFIERSNKRLCKVSLVIECEEYYELIKHKHKLVDPNHPNKIFGTIKFNLQKSKQHRSVQSLDFWKEASKKKTACSLKIEQLSVYYEDDERLSVIIKTDSEQKRIGKLRNINFFEQDTLINNAHVVISPSNDEVIYMSLKRQLKFDQEGIGDDFVGIAVLNSSDFRIGLSAVEVEFYKNQERMGTLNFLLTKYVAMKFIKSIYQSESLACGKILHCNIEMNKMLLSGYFYSFKYDREGELFCIIEVNRVKKVLILEPTLQNLSFVPSSSSDSLKFIFQADEILKVKMTLMIGDGTNESIYGTSTFTLKSEQLKETNSFSIKDWEIFNHAEILVGNSNIQITLTKEENRRFGKQKQGHKSTQKSPLKSFGKNNQKPTVKRHNPPNQNERNKSLLTLDNLQPQQQQQQRDIKQVKNHLVAGRKHREGRHNKINYSMDYGTSGKQQSVESTSVRLPKINEVKVKRLARKDNSLENELFSGMMNVRKRTIGGYDCRVPKNESEREMGESLTIREEKQLNYQNIRDNNPNIDRNFEILFPSKKPLTKEQRIKSELNKYEVKLKGLKSVLNKINDIDPIQPTIREGNNTDYLSKMDTHNYEFEGNEFV